MRTEELRAELEQLAGEMEPFEADLLGVHRAVRRRRVGLSAVAAVVALVVLAGAIATRGSNKSNEQTLAASAKVVPFSSLHRADVVIVPANHDIQHALDASPLVGHYALVPRGFTAATEGGFRSTDLTCALRDSNGIAVEAAGLGDITAGLQHLLGRHATVYDLTRGNQFDVEIFMKVNATDAQTAGARDNLQRLQSVRSFVFADHNAALEEFKKVFANQPALTSGTQQVDLPESFRVVAKDSEAASLVTAVAQSWPGVDTVVRRSATMSILPPVKRSTTDSSYDAEVFMKPDAAQSVIDAIRQELATDPAVASARFLNHDDAYAVFLKEFKDQPALIESTKPSQLPVSFRVKLHGSINADTWLLRYNTQSGVENVITHAQRTADPCAKN